MFEYFKSITETVAQNSANLIELYKKDLNEFAAVVSNELQLPPPPSSSSEQPSSSLTTTLSEILHNEQSYLQPIYLTDENDLNTIQIDINSDQVTTDITLILENDSILKDIHMKLVPSQVSYLLFWKRYFQLKINFEEFEKKRKLFESLKEETKNTNTTTTREEFYLNVLNEILESDEFKTVNDVKEFIKIQLSGIVESNNGSLLVSDAARASTTPSSHAVESNREMATTHLDHHTTTNTTEASDEDDWE
ncbi:hypothetical protein C9374_006962 [Naegleria lovaniensis]|uniref:BSD domain-containing protein n=1 Tax=Naegleria lovaniensis TaxID=51637 RepID=A0AA88H672_NAELO|nr:uncharacterized protein C9374_006962 [Naegleria lovaniensis]KAG2393431.1 hypothetical protein C9374_006962 [Naegleria lovaniensis]